MSEKKTMRMSEVVVMAQLASDYLDARDNRDTEKADEILERIREFNAEHEGAIAINDIPLGAVALIKKGDK